MKLQTLPATIESNSQKTLLMYVNDVLALEHDIHEAVSRQTVDEQLRQTPEVAAVVDQIAASTNARILIVSELSRGLGGGAGAVKEVVAAAAGALAGIYGKVRKHAVSRNLRDDYTALALLSTAYSMLYTTALALRSSQVAAVARGHLREVTPLIMQLSRVIPGAVVTELAEEFPDVNREADAAGREVTVLAWAQHAAA